MCVRVGNCLKGNESLSLQACVGAGTTGGGGGGGRSELSVMFISSFTSNSIVCNRWGKLGVSG